MKKYEAKAITKATKKKGLEKFFGDEDESL
jgi:hypothetical protein